MEGNEMCTVGNITIGMDGSQKAPGHKYQDFKVHNNVGFHVGNVGLSDGHHYKNMSITNNKASTVGNYNRLDAMQEDIRRKREATGSSPH